jgi:hypothetical protein
MHLLRSSKRVPGQIYGDAAVCAYLDSELAGCKPEHRETLKRLKASNQAVDLEMEADTVARLQHHADEIRRYQIEYDFVMPGILELIDALDGRGTIHLRP